MNYLLLSILFLTLNATANEMQISFNQGDIRQLPVSDWQASRQERNIRNALLNNEIPSEEIELDDSLFSMNRLIQANAFDKKPFAKAAAFKAVEEEWQGNLEQTILNDTNAQTFAEFSEELERRLQERTYFLGFQQINGQRYYVFNMADFAHARVRQDKQHVIVDIAFNNKANDNRVEAIGK